MCEEGGRGWFIKPRESLGVSKCCMQTCTASPTSPNTSKTIKNQVFLTAKRRTKEKPCSAQRPAHRYFGDKIKSNPSVCQRQK